MRPCLYSLHSLCDSTHFNVNLNYVMAGNDYLTVSVYMKRNRLWLGDFSHKRPQKGARKRKENDIRLKKKLFSHKTLTSYEKLILKCW